MTGIHSFLQLRSISCIWKILKFETEYGIKKAQH